MTITEQILARSRSEESFWGVTRPAALFAMLALLSGDIAVSPAILSEKSYYKAIEASSCSVPVSQIIMGGGTEKRRYQPRTALGERLIAIREQAIAKGLRLLDADEIIEEVRRRRGEID